MSGPKHATTKESGSRTYSIPQDDGTTQEYPSVTTILGVLDKPGLTYWAANQVAEFTRDNLDVVVGLKDDPAAMYDLLKKSPWRKRDAAAVKGTDAHAILERFILEDTVPTEDIHPDLRRYVNAGLNFIKDYKVEFEAAEASCFNHAHRYAGTMDAIGLYEGRRFVIDWKTRQGKSVSQVKGYESELLQITAYVQAEGLLLPDGSTVAMPEVVGGSVVMLCEDGYVVEKAVPVRDWPVFQLVREVYEWRKNL